MGLLRFRGLEKQPPLCVNETILRSKVKEFLGETAFALDAAKLALPMKVVTKVYLQRRHISAKPCFIHCHF